MCGEEGDHDSQDNRRHTHGRNDSRFRMQIEILVQKSYGVRLEAALAMSLDPSSLETALPPTAVVDISIPAPDLAEYMSIVDSTIDRIVQSTFDGD